MEVMIDDNDYSNFCGRLMHETGRDKKNNLKKKQDTERFGIQNKTSQMDDSENMLMKKQWLLHERRVYPISTRFSDHCLFKIVFFVSLMNEFIV